MFTNPFVAIIANIITPFLNVAHAFGRHDKNPTDLCLQCHREGAV